MFFTSNIAVFLIYLCVAGAVVALANQAAKYVDLLDSKTGLSGAFLGGVLLSAVTSLPELFTSLSATILLREPGLCMGNILGSNLFNLLILACCVLLFRGTFQSEARIARSHCKVGIFTLLIFAVLLLNCFGIFHVTLGSIDLCTPLILVLYVLGVRAMGGDSESEAPTTECSDLSLRQIIVRFLCVALCLIGLSVFLTYLTDDIAEILDLSSSLAGAIFLGVATSLPELASTFALFRLRNYNVAIGNIIGSNLFNFIILALADVAYLGGGVYLFSDRKTVLLLVLGTVATVLSLLLLRWKNKVTALLTPLGVILCYWIFLIL